jgi:chromosome partitioning protein
MEVLTLLNEKGGVGKTTLAVHMAMGLALRGYRTLLLDADPQGHATIRCGLEKAPGMYELMMKGAAWGAVCQTVAPERYGIPGEIVPEALLRVVPSNVETRRIGDVDDALLLADRLDEIDDVDVVVVDTPPTPSVLHGVIYMATTTVIYPTTLTYTAFDGLAESIRRREAADMARHAKWGLPAIRLGGIVPVAYRANTAEQTAHLESLRRAFGGRVWRAIPQRVIWQESESAARPVFALEPNGDAAADVWEILDNTARLFAPEPMEAA